MKISVAEFERKVWELESVRIVVRLPARAKVPDYHFVNAAAGSSSVMDWRTNRLTKLLGDDVSVVIIDPTRFDTNLRIYMETLRARYTA